MSAAGQQHIISGIIKDENARPLPGVSIKIKDNAAGTVTDLNGAFSLSAAKGQVLEISYVSKASQEIPVGLQITLNIVLQQGETSNLNDVIVTGYMTQKKANLTGSISVVNTQELNKDHGISNVFQSLQCVVPGLHITTDGSPVGNVGVQLRGISSVNG